MDILEKLFEKQDKKYAEFQKSLTPMEEEKPIIGVRVPVLRQFAREIKGTNEAEEFLNNLPHRYYDEDMLHSILLSEDKDYDRSIDRIEKFLPFIDNWAVCDTLKSKAFKKNKDKLIEKIKEWSQADMPFTIRFGLEMLMTYYLDEDFKEEYLEIPASVRSEKYYVRMMQAWFFATALAKQWDKTIPYLINNSLDVWTHNKTIQKARESYRITAAQKEYLNTLKRK